MDLLTILSALNRLNLSVTEEKGRGELDLPRGNRDRCVEAKKSHFRSDARVQGWL